MTKRNPLIIVLGLSFIFFIIFVAIAVGTVMSLNGGSANQKKLFAKANRIGVIEIKGVIMDSRKILEQVDTFAEDKNIKGVLVRINSPGGAVAPSQEIFSALRRLDGIKPVYASMNSVAASGGYYAAIAARKVFASPGTITGSIGVIMQFADMSKLYQWAKVNPYVIKTGKFKDTGNPAREMSLEEKALLQGMVDNVLGQFRKAVSDSRKLPMDRVIELSDGRIYSGEQAHQNKLIDELGGIEETTEALAKEAGIKGKPTLVYGTKKHVPWEKFFGDLDEDTESRSFLGSIALQFVQHLFGEGFSGNSLGGTSPGVLDSTVMFLAPY